jgi:hypothetical protein
MHCLYPRVISSLILKRSLHHPVLPHLQALLQDMIAHEIVNLFYIKIYRFVTMVY